MEYSIRIIESNDWATYLLVLCFLLIALAKYFYPRRFDDFMMLPVNNKFFTVHGKEDNLQHPFNIIFFGVQVICATVFIKLLIENTFEGSRDNPWLLLQICAFYCLFVLAKMTIEKIVANLFSIDSIIDHYLYQKLSYRNFISLFLFAGSLIFIYIFPGQYKAMLVFVLAILALNVITLLYSYKKNGILIASNFLYFILYLCALEISPYIILYRLIITDTSI
ncbi:MAG TPA: DUF4271 domain-containing protein [Aequorivita sp.]|nr:DUF4271 domain-containing protein [Aequorivita sp.]